MKKQTIFVFLALFSLFGCFGKGHGESAVLVDPGKAEGEGRSIRVSYHIDITKEGTRSEGRSHVLAVNSYTLPDVFTLVYAANKPYQFAVKTQTWGDGGYILDRDGENMAPFKETTNAITPDDWVLGWYEGDKRKKGTPRSWVYVERDGLTAFVNPDELDRFIAFKGFEVMDRDKTRP
jgi:hypothetical protein